MRWIKVKDYEELSEKAAEILMKQLESKPDSVIGLATGGTPIGMYQQLVSRYERGDISFARVTAFNLDEYIGMGKEQPESFHAYMEHHFFGHVDLSETSRHIPDGMAENLEEACEAYEADIQASGGIDLQVVGIGQNGHIGFNEPGTSFQSRTHVTELSASTRRANAKYFNGKEMPEQAITMGLQTIMKARSIVLLAYGHEKRKALDQLRTGTITESFPASCLHEHPNVTVLYGEESEGED
ncbi:glucosamine-6-phosphate deaminase [Sporosarcina luteola]|nr:glucosamine-6-phosphate deaminase [Sporosarcina luteola]